MMRGRLGPLLGALLVLLQSAGAWHEEFRLSAYVNIEHGPWFPEYKTGNVDWARVAQRATDLILYSIEPSSDGGVVHVPHVPPGTPELENTWQRAWRAIKVPELLALIESSTHSAFEDTSLMQK